jgi:acyl-CoA reductase-like NAD-dependent aldehyde dehydrogenase
VKYLATATLIAMAAMAYAGRSAPPPDVSSSSARMRHSSRSPLPRASEHPLCQEEPFGPSPPYSKRRPSEAVALANGARFGLVTSVHGLNLDRPGAVRHLDTGIIKGNAPTTGVDFYAPFGGEKESSYGSCEQGMAALEFYGATRTVTIAPPPSSSAM